MEERVNSLPDDKISALSEFKVFADDNFSMAELLKIIWVRIENILGKDGNA